MDEIQFAGVKNKAGKSLVITYGGQKRSFLKDEIAVVDAGLAQFLKTRSHITSDGKLVTRKFLFESVPLAEALKHVKEPENKSIAAAKQEAEERDKIRKELLAEVVADLKTQGWVAPKTASAVPPKLA